VNPIVFALRRPWTVLVLVAAVALCSLMALANLLPGPVRALMPIRSMPVDIFPDLNTCTSTAFTTSSRRTSRAWRS
jgi:hypothetical protein